MSTAITRSDADSFGAWELPEPLRDLQATVASFMANEVRPAEEELDPDAWELPANVLEPLQKRAKQAGLWCIESPAEYGGAGLNLLSQVIVAEQASQCRMGAYVPAAGAFGWDPPNVIYDGTEEQITRWAVPTVESGCHTFVAISEPSGGADPARAIRTRARRDGTDWVINGSKTWISKAAESEWGIVFARTGDEPGGSAISCFIVEADAPGLTRSKIPVIRSWSPCELTFEDVRVPQENLLGEVGRGFALAQRWLVNNRVTYAAAVIGVAQAAINLAIKHAKNRESFGGRLADKQAIQWMIADSEIDLRAARLLTYQAAWKADLGKDFKVDASIAKVHATEAAGRVVDRAVQILGGLGVAKEMPTERWYREMRIKRIGEGPSEVHRMVIARDIIKGSR
ncbi:acyl-CoA dehydrogenase family protein [Saccharomonospora sp. NPDC046836]|uniref:acyl-CoA dehydrogenase family protein n=1 Tax=Saccharomonospora sp. NPDC046836 TaxID=3156921 RepID=UPI0033E6631C